MSGKLILNLVPTPSSVWTSIRPLTLAISVFTTSMPTPRPESSLTSRRVVKPGRKMRLIASESESSLAAAGLRNPPADGLRARSSGSIPRPSSSTSRMIEFPSWRARRMVVPVGSLPRRIRSSRGSIPCETALRTSA